MNKGYKLYCLTAFIMLFAFSNAHSQVDTQKVMPPKPLQYNAGFDVIITINGEIVYGLVKEVGLYLISYQRTDIPDGPIYTIPRSEVYAISYRNQVKELITPIYGDPSIRAIRPYPHIDYRYNNFFKNGTVFIGLGFLRSFSKVKDVKTYSSSGSFPAISFGYDVSFRSNVRLGLQLGFGSHNFSNQQFSSYDSTINNVTLKENIFALYVYGRYALLQSTSRFQPYIMAGVGVTSSNIKSQNEISFTNNNPQIILVKSGTRSAGLGIMARIGSQYFISDQLQVFLDAGFGLSVLNVGLSVAIK